MRGLADLSVPDGHFQMENELVLRFDVARPTMSSNVRALKINALSSVRFVTSNMH
jgi:hypothetical protein